MREIINFNSDWQFILGDEHLSPPPFKEIVYQEAKTERALRGYASKNYGHNREILYERWEHVTLPHDFIIPQEPKEEYNNTLGYFHYQNAWYRKSFRVEEADAGKRLALYFEGVATHATVYVNGCLMAHNFCGYTAFAVDITDVVQYGALNVVSVYVNTTDKHEGWWYSGGGIYRPVKLIKTELVSVDLWGIYVHPEKTVNGWRIPIDVTVRCDDHAADTRSVTVTAELLDGGTVCAASAPVTLTVHEGDTADAHLTAFLETPHLWSCDDPHLYTCRVRIADEETELDCDSTFFGFRTLRFDPDNGFFLNDLPTKIKGVCCHEDYGLQGKAVSDSVKQLRLERLREMGANGYRCAHYPHSEATFRYLAELGFLVMAETRWFESTKEGLEQLEMLVKCHRNNPAVIMWSLGNEEPLHNTPVGKKIFMTMRAHARRFDRTRPFTTAVSHNPAGAPVMDAVDIIGINYNLRDYDALHEKYPDKMIFASECCAVGSTRGWTMDDDPARGYLHCYDNRAGWFMAREVTWNYIMERPWLAGGYQWAGIEHRGETVWPRLCSQSGALDLFLQKKDAFYQNKSHWCDEPLVHIYPHWNLSGREGETIPVWVYTNCDRIALYQDGCLQAEKDVKPYGHAEFDVVYTPGRLEAVGYRNGTAAARDTVETTGPAVTLKLELQNKHPLQPGDAAIFNCYAYDAAGRFVPNAAPMVHFHIKGAGVIVGTGSDVCDHTPVPAPDRRMRAGIVSACVLCRGDVTLYAQAEGLSGDRITVAVQ